MGNRNERRDEQSNSESEETSEFSGPLPSGKPGARICDGAQGVLSVIREEGLGLPILSFLLGSLVGHLQR